MDRSTPRRERHRAVAPALLTAALALTSCAAARTGGSSTSATSSTSAPAAAGSGGSGVSAWSGTPVSPAAIPIGDGKVSSAPQVGSQDSCTTVFRGGGARGTGPWIDTSAGTWDARTKIAVAGSHAWPGASHSFTVQGDVRVLSTDDLPVGATTGTFPIAADDPAYQYDRNPNSVAAQSLSWQVPADPVAAASPACTPLGPIGVATNGVVIFNALDAAGRDAGAHEIQDSCGGHPDGSDEYHYHDLSPCLETAATDAAGSSTLIGYALDGFGIYLERDAKGNLPTDADLDACHGRTSTVQWDGRNVSMYHYDVTLEYPYFVGCFHGTPVSNRSGP